MVTFEDCERLLSDSKEKNEFSKSILISKYNFNVYDCNKFLLKGFFLQSAKGYYHVDTPFIVHILSNKLSNAIHKQDYSTAVDIILELSSIDKENLCDYNLYLYLITMIIELPDIRLTDVKDFKETDIISKDIVNNRGIYKLIFEAKINQALKAYRACRTTQKDYQLYDEIVLSLLVAIYKNERNLKLELIELIDTNYDFAIELLNAKSEGPMNDGLKSILKLIKLYKAIKEYRLMPFKKDITNKTHENLLIAGDFEILYKLVQEHSKRNNLTAKVFNKIVKKLYKELSELKASGEILLTLEVDAILALSDAINFYLKGDLIRARLAIEKFLEEKEKVKDDYVDFILENIELGITMQDESFYIAFKTLAIILNGNHSLEWIKKDLANRPNDTKKYAIMPKKKYNKIIQTE